MAVMVVPGLEIRQGEADKDPHGNGGRYKGSVVGIQNRGSGKCIREH
jgi:hypothetical protein